MKKKEIIQKAKGLSSETRLNLIELIGVKEHTVSELKEKYDEEYEGKTRETIYRELEKLVDAEILEKQYDKGIKSFLYSITSRKIEIELVSEETE